MWQKHPITLAYNSGAAERLFFCIGWLLWWHMWRRHVYCHCGYPWQYHWLYWYSSHNCTYCSALPTYRKQHWEVNSVIQTAKNIWLTVSCQRKCTAIYGANLTLNLWSKANFTNLGCPLLTHYKNLQVAGLELWEDSKYQKHLFQLYVWNTQNA